MAPPHATIVHLVRMGDQQGASGTNVWDTPVDIPWIPQFEYNICRGPRDEEVIRDPSRGRLCAQVLPSTTDELQASASYLQHLLGGLEQSVERCQLAAAQLESLASAAPTAPTDRDSETPAAPVFEGSVSGRGTGQDSSSSSGPHLRVFICLLGLNLARFEGGSPFSVGCLMPLIGRGAADGMDSENEASDRDGPSEPSSPDLADVSAPTPGNEVIRVGERNSFSVLQRASNEPLASTSAPMRGDTEPVLQPFCADLVASMQRRVTACLGEVDVEPAPRPFIPQGCPFTIHNPFTTRSQCQVMSATVHTPQHLREILADFSARRGWQPLVSVQPQPNEAAVHLIPAAADPTLVSVLFRAGHELIPSCIGRVTYGSPYCRLSVGGRQARMREPYPVCRGRDGAARLRDGDCVHADLGPYGPPPPEPLHSHSHRFALSAWAAGILLSLHTTESSLGFFLLGLLSVQAVQFIAPEPVTGREVQYAVGHFPWRRAPEARTLSLVCRAHRCRLTLLCPWSGPQGVFQCRSDDAVLALWARYTDLGYAPDFVPTWPCLSDDKLWLVPRAPVDSGLSCTVASQNTLVRAMLIPDTRTYAQLCRTVQYQTGWEGRASSGTPCGTRMADKISDNGPICQRWRCLGCTGESRRMPRIYSPKSV